MPSVSPQAAATARADAVGAERDELAAQLGEDAGKLSLLEAEVRERRLACRSIGDPGRGRMQTGRRVRNRTGRGRGGMRESCATAHGHACACSILMGRDRGGTRE